MTSCESLRSWLIGAIALFYSLTAAAHLNSPHIFVEENAGPYPVIAIVRMPPAVPGSAEVQVMLKNPSDAEGVQVWIREVPPEGEAQAPGWSQAIASDRNFFTKPVPLMVLGAWRVQIRVKGARGEGTLEIPVSARTAAPKTMEMGITLLLSALLGLLYSSGYQLLSGLGRDASRGGSEDVSRSAIRKGRLYAAVGLSVLSGYIGILAYVWYLAHVNTVASSRPSLVAQLTPNEPIVAGKPLSMDLSIADSDGRPLLDCQPDHGKIMHMVVVDVPRATQFFHLHPRWVGSGRFTFQFSPPAPGRYKVFADVLRSSGEGDTITTNLDVAAAATSTSASAFDDPDDSYSAQKALGARAVDQRVDDVGDGLEMTWKQPSPGSIRKGEFQTLTFQLSNANGKPVALEPYMGMDGHLLIMGADANMFAHVHPMGTLPGRMMPMAIMPVHAASSGVSFPYGFPEKGLYRLWVQVKHEGRIRTGVFDLRVN